jgi:hypothetical protein
MKQETKEKLAEMMIILVWIFIFVISNLKDKLKKSFFMILALLCFFSGTVLFVKSISSQQDQFPIVNLYLYLVFLLLVGILFACHACSQIRSGCYRELEIEME